MVSFSLARNLFALVHVCHVSASKSGTSSRRHVYADQYMYPGLNLRQVAPTSDPCGHKATCYVTGQVSEFVWRPIRAPSTFTAFTVLTVINTVVNTTKTSTIIADHPQSYTPPPTNSLGKRIHTLTYNANGAVTTTVIAFPTVFFDWPTQYAVSGEYVLTRTNGKSECVSFGTAASTVIPIKGDPQPGPPRNTYSQLSPGADVLGWGYTMEFDNGFGSGNLQALVDLLPEDPGVPHSVVKGCVTTTVFPANNKFDASWMAVGANSVMYVGNEHEEPATLTSVGPKTSPGPTTKNVASQPLPRVTGTATAQRNPANANPGAGTGAGSHGGPQTSQVLQGAGALTMMPSVAAWSVMLIFFV